MNQRRRAIRDHRARALPRATAALRIYPPPRHATSQRLIKFVSSARANVYCTGSTNLTAAPRLHHYASVRLFVLETDRIGFYWQTY